MEKLPRPVFAFEPETPAIVISSGEVSLRLIKHPESGVAVPHPAVNPDDSMAPNELAVRLMVAALLSSSQEWLDAPEEPVFRERIEQAFEAFADLSEEDPDQAVMLALGQGIHAVAETMARAFKRQHGPSFLEPLSQLLPCSLECGVPVDVETVKAHAPAIAKGRDVWPTGWRITCGDQAVTLAYFVDFGFGPVERRDEVAERTQEMNNIKLSFKMLERVMSRLVLGHESHGHKIDDSVLIGVMGAWEGLKVEESRFIMENASELMDGSIVMEIDTHESP